MSLLNLFSSEKKQSKEKRQNPTEDANHYHMEQRTHPIRLIFPMPKVEGSVGGGGSVYNGSGGGLVEGYTGTKYQLMVFFETGDGGWRWQIFDIEDIRELLKFTDDESHVIVQYQCADSDNHVMNIFYDGIYINRHWQQTGR